MQPATQIHVDLVSGSRRSSSREPKSTPKAYWTTYAGAEGNSNTKPPPIITYIPARTTRRNFMLAVRRADALGSAGSWAPSRAARPVFRLAQLGPWLFKQSMMHHGHGGQEARRLCYSPGLDLGMGTAHEEHVREKFSGKSTVPEKFNQLIYIRLCECPPTNLASRLRPHSQPTHTAFLSPTSCLSHISPKSATSILIIHSPLKMYANIALIAALAAVALAAPMSVQGRVGTVQPGQAFAPKQERQLDALTGLLGGGGATGTGGAGGAGGGAGGLDALVGVASLVMSLRQRALSTY